MNTSCWLKVSENGSVKVTKKRPWVDVDEVAVFINIALPDSLFTKPKLSASISLLEEDVKCAEMDAEVIDNVEEAILSATGLEFKISVIDPEVE